MRNLNGEELTPEQLRWLDDTVITVALFLMERLLFKSNYDSDIEQLVKQRLDVLIQRYTNTNVDSL